MQRLLLSLDASYPPHPPPAVCSLGESFAREPSEVVRIGVVVGYSRTGESLGRDMMGGSPALLAGYSTDQSVNQSIDNQ